MKRSGIERKTELQRRTPLENGPGMMRSTPARRSPREIKPKPKPPPKRQKTRAESDPEWTPARLGALDRDCHRCCRCGKRATEVHHRRLLGMGGSSDPDRHRFDRIISLCAACHHWAHHERDEAEEAGYIVPHPDAWTVPVQTIDGPRWLLPSGVVCFTAA